LIKIQFQSNLHKQIFLKKEKRKRKKKKEKRKKKKEKEKEKRKRKRKRKKKKKKEKEKLITGNFYDVKIYYILIKFLHYNFNKNSILIFTSRSK
jgi:hypothetical protein